MAETAKPAKAKKEPKPKFDVAWKNQRDTKCDKRQETIKEEFGYKAQCLVQSEVIFLTGYKNRHDDKKFSKKDVFEISRMHRRVFGVRTRLCSNCNSAAVALNRMVEELMNVYSTYLK